MSDLVGEVYFLTYMGLGCLPGVIVKARLFCLFQRKGIGYTIRDAWLRDIAACRASLRALG